MKISRFELEDFLGEDSDTETEILVKVRKPLKIKADSGTSYDKKRSEGSKRRDRQLHRAFRRGDMENFQE